jgi:ATP-dependent Clp protease adapter protein ClpS
VTARSLEAVLVLVGFFVVLPCVLFFGLRWLFRWLARPPIAWFKPPGGTCLAPGVSLLQLPGFMPQGFVNGVEILNDNTTPMEFVVSVLQKHADLDRKSSIRTMLTIHYKGGILLPFQSQEFAERVANSISAEASAHNHQLICRAVRTVALDSGMP